MDAVIYQTKIKQYTFVYSDDKFITVYTGDGTEENKFQSIYRIHSPCRDKKEFETEIIYIQATVLNKDPSKDIFDY